MQATPRPRVVLESMAHHAYVRRTTLPLLVSGMGGLGDNVYERPVIRALAASTDKLWMATPYPELFEDIENVQPVRWSNLQLRCQQKNMARQPRETYQLPPSNCERIRLHYALARLTDNVVRELEAVAGIHVPTDKFRFDLPDFGPSLIRERYAVIRPVTVRREWPNYARNPLPEYIDSASRILHDLGYLVVSVADVDPPHERYDGEAPFADIRLDRGELNVYQLVSLIRGASVVAGGVGWIVPMGAAARVPTVVVAGGQGGHNGPAVLLDGRMNVDRLRFVLPDRYCRCREMSHRCEKTISSFEAKFISTLDDVCFR